MTSLLFKIKFLDHVLILDTPFALKVGHVAFSLSFCSVEGRVCVLLSSFQYLFVEQIDQFVVKDRNLE